MSPIIRDGEFEIYQADIRQPRKASLMVYQDSHCWITLADSQGAETTIFANLDDEGDRNFAEELGMVAGVLAVMMSQDGGGDEAMATKG